MPMTIITTFLFIISGLFLIVSAGTMGYYANKDYKETLNNQVLIKAGLIVLILNFATWFLMFIAIFVHSNSSPNNIIDDLLRSLFLIGGSSLCLSLMTTILLFGSTLYRFRKLKEKQGNS